MFANSIFKITFGVSLLAHIALLVPYSHFFSHTKDIQIEEVSDMNYIIIEYPEVTEEEEEIVVKVEDLKQESEARSQKSPTVPTRVWNSSENCSKPGLEQLGRVIIPEPRTPAIDRQKALLKYYNVIREKIRASIYKLTTKVERIGIVRVIFTISPDGYIQNINDIASDNISPRVKQKTMHGIKHAQPFPPFPKEIGIEPICFSIAIKFTID